MGRASPLLNLLHGDAQSAGDVLHRLTALRYDAHVRGDRPCRDGMVSGNHDDLQIKVSYFHDYQ